MAANVTERQRQRVYPSWFVSTGFLITFVIFCLVYNAKSSLTLMLHRLLTLDPITPMQLFLSSDICSSPHGAKSLTRCMKAHSGSKC